MKLYFALLALTALERLIEMLVSRSNARWSMARGGREVGREHFPAMVVLHTAFLVGCALEPWLTQRSRLPPYAPLALGVVLVCHALRWWCIATLGRRWNARVIVVPGLPRIDTGPYRWLDNPNYLAVVLEGVALPAMAGAWMTAWVFTALNALLLRRRIQVEKGVLEDFMIGVGDGSARST